MPTEPTSDAWPVQHIKTDPADLGKNLSSLDASPLPTPITPTPSGLSPAPSINSTVPRKRRASGSNASRGVANLTPEQLAKKRANDREAQRAIRERTRTQIETLERRIQELTTTQPYQELQLALRQKEALQAENDEIRRRLSTVLSVIQPILCPVPGTEQSSSNIPNGPSTSYHHHSLVSPSYNDTDGPHRYHHPSQPDNAHPSPSSFTGPSATSSAYIVSPVEHDPHQKGPQLQYAAGHGQGRLPVVDFARQKEALSHGLNLTASGERLGLDFLLDGSQRINKVPSEHGRGLSSTPLPDPENAHGSPAYGRGSSARSSSQCDDDGQYNQFAMLVPHATPIKNIPATCPLDGLLLDFLHERQHQAAQGVSKNKLVGPAYPSIASLLNPERSKYSHPLSKVFTDILSKFPDLSTLPEQIATLYIMFLIMRWQISPTQEHYDRLPDWVTPRASQILTPHPAWIDHLPWPRQRDVMIRNQQNYIFDDFFIPFTTTLSLNWPYESTDTLLSSPNSEEIMINPVFERHLRNLNNWSLGPAFAKAFPDLADTVRIKPDDPRVSKPG
ncbi:MAG: hypothetical protein M1817_004127 [Caeruleum heppii]|nr:MAG: hypothetical protein M1817_004127 [Caeruleum heppii]